MRCRLVLLLAILTLLCDDALARFYKKTNSKQKATPIDNYRCAADCLQDPKCKGFSTQRDVYPQCVTHGEEIFNISESISIDSWVKECPKGFVSNIYQFQCYLFVEDQSSWYNASSFCEDKNAYLAELIDPTERIAVWNYAKDLNIRKELWVGITQRDLRQRGRYRHYRFYKAAIDIPSTYEHWANRYLPKKDYPEACGYIIPPTDNWKFYDDQCINPGLGFVCEW